MIVCRTFTLLFLVCITACGVCSSLFPLFRRNYDVLAVSGPSSTTTTTVSPIQIGSSSSGSSSDTTSTSTTTTTAAPPASTYHRREVVYYWYTENTTAGSYPTLSYTREYNSARACDTSKMYFVVASALSTAGTSLAGIACMMSAAWIYAGFDSCLHSFILFVTFLSFACYVVTVALVAFLYTNDTCKDSVDRATALKNASPKFNIVEGFILLCVAAGGTLVAMILEALSFCVCTDTDDYCGGRHRRNDADFSSYGDDRSVLLSDGSVLTVRKPSSAYRSRAASSASVGRSRGESSMSRRSSSGSLSRTSSSSSIGSSDSSYSSRSSRSSRSGHRRP